MIEANFFLSEDSSANSALKGGELLNCHRSLLHMLYKAVYLGYGYKNNPIKRLPSTH